MADDDLTTRLRNGNAFAAGDLLHEAADAIQAARRDVADLDAIIHEALADIQTYLDSDSLDSDAVLQHLQGQLSRAPQGAAEPKPTVTMTDAALAGLISALTPDRVTVAPERETLEKIIEPVAGRVLRATLAWDRSLAIATAVSRALLASGVLGVPADQVRAQTLEAAARAFPDRISLPLGGRDGDYSERAAIQFWLRARAAEYRKPGAKVSP